MNERAKLGFAIPTYRRPALLDLALRSIVPQAQLLGAPIYIPDNSCDQTNVAIVRGWQSIYPNVIHETNSENLGIDRNVHKAIIRCPADYVHVLGDDDLIFPGFAQQVIRIIADQAPGHIVCSYMYLANNHQPISGAAVIPADSPASSMRALLPQYGWALGFIGAHVFHRERFATCAVDGFGSYFHHLIRLINYIDPDERLGFVPAPLVGNRADDESTPTWSASRLTVVFGLEKALANAMQDRYSPAEIERSISRARTVFGYARFGRLLYTAALAEQSGHAAQYWEALAKLVPPSRYRALRGVPRFVYRPLLQLMSLGRRTKRQVQALVRDA